MIFYTIEWIIDNIVMPILMAVLLAFCILFVVFFIALASGEKLPSTKAYEQCLEDGRKQYECYAMIYGKGTR